MASERADDWGGWLTGALDPAANLRTMLDPRGAGRRIAEDFADQLLARLDGPRDGNGATPPTDADLGHVLRQLQADGARLGEVSANLLEQVFVVLSAVVMRVQGGQGKSATEPLLLGQVAPGEQASAVFWVHNTAAGPVPEVRPHCGALRSHTGSELAPGSVRFDPPILDPLPARSSCGVEVQVRVPRSATPGTYVALILASNAPDWYLPLSLTVADAAQEPQ